MHSADRDWWDDLLALVGWFLASRGITAADFRRRVREEMAHDGIVLIDPGADLPRSEVLQ
jgi:hypothetical protein